MVRERVLTLLHVPTFVMVWLSTVTFTDAVPPFTASVTAVPAAALRSDNVGVITTPKLVVTFATAGALPLLNTVPLLSVSRLNVTPRLLAAVHVNAADKIRCGSRLPPLV